MEGEVAEISTRRVLTIGTRAQTSPCWGAEGGRGHSRGFPNYQDNLPLWAFLLLLSNLNVRSTYTVSTVYGCSGSRRILQLAATEVKSGGSGGWSGIRRQQSSARGHAYVRALMSHRHILYEETRRLPLPLYVSGQRPCDVSKGTPSEASDAWGASVGAEQRRRDLKPRIFDRRV